MVPMPEHINADFALRCKGDSMINARILDNDIVYIRKQDTVENGEIAEEGAPEDLLAKGGVYYKLFTLQSEAMKKVLAGM